MTKDQFTNNMSLTTLNKYYPSEGY